MSTRRAKQLIYGMFYAILWIVFVGVIYFAVRLLAPAAPAPVGCTAMCEPTSTAPIATSTVWTFVTSPGHYTFLAQVADTDPDYAAPYFGYAVNLRDASGTVLQSLPGTSFIYNGETKYLVMPNVAVAQPFISADLAVTSAYWEASSSLGAVPHFSLQNVAAAGTSSTVSVSGQLTNANIAVTRYVFVDAVFFGPDGSPIGASQTELNNVAPGQTIGFSVMYPQTGAIDPAANQVLVYGLK